MPVGKGIPTSITRSVFTLDSINGKLYVGGLFDSAGGQPAHNIAVWDGASWSTLGSGANGEIWAITEYKGNIYVAGCFDTIGGLPIKGIAEWNGSAWLPLGTGVNNCVDALTVFDSVLIAGGLFDSAGGVFVNYIAQWNGTKWDSIGSGMNSFVNALTVYANGIVAGGFFSTAGGVLTGNVAFWNGSWTNILSYGNVGNVNAFGILNNANLFVGGGTGSFIEGYNGNYYPLGFAPNGGVNAITVYDGNVVAGGWFKHAGGYMANSIAVWTSGIYWDTLGNGLNAVVHALAVYNGNLYAGGNFDSAGIVRATGIAEWCGTCPNAIEKLSKQNESVGVFPNPSNGKFTIEVKSEELRTKSRVEIYNVLGEKVYTSPSVPLQRGSSSPLTIDITGKSAGVYLYRLVKEDGTLIGSGKLVIQN